MWRYLREFLSDPRVIELPRLIWYPILYGIVLTTRPRKSGAKYETIWNQARERVAAAHLSPAPRASGWPKSCAATARCRRRLGDALRQPVDRKRAEPAERSGCDRILTFPLYPQYSATTTATANDKFFRALMKMRGSRRCAACRPITTSRSISRRWPARSSSIWRRSTSSRRWCSPPTTASRSAYFEKGDPYHCHCQKTTRLLRERLGWDEKKLITTFQSRFGAQEWLQPYTDKTVEKLAQDGVKSIAVVNPGFSADCIETLEEIAGEVREIFHACRRRELRPHPLPQRQRRGHGGDRDDGAPRACRAGS